MGIVSITTIHSREGKAIVHGMNRGKTEYTCHDRVLHAELSANSLLTSSSNAGQLNFRLTQVYVMIELSLASYTLTFSSISL